MVFPTNRMGKYQISISGFGHGNLGPYYKPQPPLIFSGLGGAINNFASSMVSCSILSLFQTTLSGIFFNTASYRSTPYLSGGAGSSATNTPSTQARSEETILEEAKGLQALSHYSASNSAGLKAQISADITARQGMLNAAKDIDIVGSDNKKLTYEQLINKLADSDETKKIALKQLFSKYTLDDNVKAGAIEEAIECLDSPFYKDAGINEDNLLSLVKNRDAVDTVKKARDQYNAAVAAEKMAGTVDPKDINKKMDALVAELAQARTGEKDINGKIKQLKTQSDDLQNRIDKIKPGKQESKKTKLEEQKRQIDNQIQTLKDALAQARKDIDNEQTDWTIPTIKKPDKPQAQDDSRVLSNGYKHKTDGTLVGPDGNDLTNIKDDDLTKAGFTKTKNNVWQYGSSYYLVNSGKIVACDKNGKVKKSGGAGGGDDPVYTPQNLTYEQMCADNWKKIKTARVGQTMDIIVGVAGTGSVEGSKVVENAVYLGKVGGSNGNWAMFKDGANNVYYTYVGNVTDNYTHGFVGKKEASAENNNTYKIYGPDGKQTATITSNGSEFDIKFKNQYYIIYTHQGSFIQNFQAENPENLGKPVTIAVNNISVEAKLLGYHLNENGGRYSIFLGNDGKVYYVNNIGDSKQLTHDINIYDDFNKQLYKIEFPKTDKSYNYVLWRYDTAGKQVYNKTYMYKNGTKQVEIYDRKGREKGRQLFDKNGKITGAVVYYNSVRYVYSYDKVNDKYIFKSDNSGNNNERNNLLDLFNQNQRYVLDPKEFRSMKPW